MLLEFIADMNLSPNTVALLKNAGWNVKQVADVMDRRAKDREIIDYAKKHGRVVITQDLDFTDFLALYGYTKPSVLQLRLRKNHPERVAFRLIEVVPKIERELEQGIVATIDEFSVRFRNLPLDIS